MGLLTSWKMVLDGRAHEGASAEGGTSGEPPLPGGGEPEDDDMIAHRMSWDAICRSDEFRGRWVALHECRYDEETGRATEGSVIDADDDLVELCARMRESACKNCAILFCSEDGEQPAARH
jgi:hypothetical protein